jgi:hypothetical protein
MAYIVADDLSDAKKKVDKLVEGFNRKNPFSVKAINFGVTNRKGLYYYLLVRDESKTMKNSGRVHAQKFVGFINKKEFGDV